MKTKVDLKLKGRVGAKEGHLFRVEVDSEMEVLFLTKQKGIGSVSVGY